MRHAEPEGGADGQHGVLGHAVAHPAHREHQRRRQSVGHGHGGGVIPVGDGEINAVRRRRLGSDDLGALDDHPAYAEVAEGREFRARPGKNRHARLAHRRREDGLLARHVLEAAELRGVGRRHEGVDGDIRLDHGRERRHFSGGADPRLDYGAVVHCGIEPGERERHAEVVVQVALGGEHAAGFAAQQQGQQILGRGLARAAGNAHDGAGEGPAVGPRDDLQRRERIGHHQLRQGQARLRRGDNRGGGAGGLGRGQKSVAVALRGPDRDKYLPGAELPAVHREPGQRRNRGRRPAPAGPFRQFTGRKSTHPDLIALMPMSSRTT